ncbi:MAG TPA: BfmA/BtgA family mobilization protein [Pedobacter sp.]|uniref:BfmA/BtgA family mobilization protein n=1 Tax=Pedobacter sp. TaxID=1411316 RepID=UPI002CB540B3|nr:BfmA/BtgA family mobilization protein [Pedobacter sp.]HMI01259.1 BfmA/BtgA family mobilization protein [Pedobacter sp.]
MEQENVNTVKYPALLDVKFGKVASSLGLTKRELFIKMVEYFYRTKKDPADTNDDLLKNTLTKSHQAYTSFIKAQEQLLLVPMKESMDKMISNQKDIVKYFNEQVVNTNKSILKNQQEQNARLLETEKMLQKTFENKERLKASFLQILNGYIRNREELGAFKTREREELAENVRKQVINL